MKNNKRIIIIEDQKIIAKVLSLLLEKKGFETTVISNAHEAVQKTIELDPFLILMDVQLNDHLTGIDIAKELRNSGVSCKIIFTTGNVFDNTKSEVKAIDNCEVLIKPVEFSEIEKFL